MTMTDAPLAPEPFASATPRPSRPRVQLLLLSAFLIVFVSIGWCARPVIGIDQGDELMYLALSHSVESGSYRESFRPTAPAHVKYPPAYPVWLVAVRKLTGERIHLIPAFNLALAAASLVLLFGIARRFEGEWFALAVIGPLVLNHGMLWIGGSYFSEALFLLCTLGALASTMRADGGDRRWAYLAIALALLAFLTRSAGIAMVIAVGLWLVIGKRNRGELIAFALGCTIVIGGWVGYASRARAESPVRSYLYDFNPSGITANHFSIGRLIAHAVSATGDYTVSLLPFELALPSIPNSFVDNVIWLMLLAVCLPLGCFVLWQRARTVLIYLAVYAGMIVAFPYVASRLLEPIIPLAMLVFLLGAWECGRQLSARARKLAMAALLIALGIGATASANASLAKVGECDRQNPLDSPHCYTSRAQALVAASRYIAEHAAPGEFAMAWRAAGVHFVSGHLTESGLVTSRIPRGALADSLRARNIGYVVLTPTANFELSEMSGALLASCTEFRLVQRFGAGTLVFAPGRSTGPTEDACQPLTDFKRRFPRRE